MNCGSAKKCFVKHYCFELDVRARARKMNKKKSSKQIENTGIAFRRETTGEIFTIFDSKQGKKMQTKLAFRSPTKKKRIHDRNKVTMHIYVKAAKSNVCGEKNEQHFLDLKSSK